MTDKIVVSGYDKTTGEQKEVEFDVTGGSAHVRPTPGPQTQGRNRDKAGITTAAKIAEYPSGADITELTIQCWFSAAVTITTADQLAALSKIYGKVVVDPASDAVAVALMAALDSISDDNGYYPIPISLPGAQTIIKIPLTKALSNGALGGGVVYGASSDGTTALDFWIGGN